ncbi:hypothetical protein [Cohnella cellulosilytica]|uniref:Butirosin biosynthesis protein H N-terminal domain-containing protein n=1 Tax=Cohnella cellulosilytica TaxID=986710 RepID=A0ABW2F876_9BACL
MSKRFVLDIAMQHQVTSYLNIAYPLLFILSDPKLEHWAKERFVHMYAQCWFGNYLRTDYTDSSRYFGDLLERISYSLSEARELAQAGGAIGFVKESLERGYAVNVFTIDLYHLPEAAEYRKEHRIHELLVYGYDDLRGRLEVIGYDRNGLFAAYSVAYASFEEALAEALAKPPDYLREALHLIRKRELRHAYRFDPAAFSGEVSKLAFSVPDRPKLFYTLADDSEAVFGMAVYDRILEQMERRLEGKPSLIVNFTTVHFIREHGKLLEERFAFVDAFCRPKGKLQSLLARYPQVAQEYEAARNGYLRQAMKESSFASRYKIADEEAFGRIYRLLKGTTEREKELLAELATELKREYA